MGREAGRAAGWRGREPAALSLSLLPHPRLARLRQEALEQEQRQVEEKALRAREAQAWAQLKEQEVLQLQVGRVSGGWDRRPGTPPWRGAVGHCLRALRASSLES